MTITNSPELWRAQLPRPQPDSHKYDRGHCVVIGGAKLTGAARLAAEAAARAGAGLTTIIAPADVADVYRHDSAPHIMVEDRREDYASHLSDQRRNALVLGPGFGPDADDLQRWLGARQGQRMVLDADGLNNLQDFSLLRVGDVLTPHMGEFKKLFGDMTPEEASKKAGCVVILKGARTTITDGARTVVNDHASPYLASAGTGDVLAGLIAGLLAQGMDSFDAACAAVWMHGQAGLDIGPGLVATDIPNAIPGVLARLV